MICYIIFPIVIWHVGRDYIGDYYTMLISTIPGIIYSFLRFLVIKKVNLFGLFMLGNLLIGTLVDVLAGSALQLLWNRVYFSCLVAALFLLTVLWKRPVFLFFALDITEMQGHDRKRMKGLFYQRKILFIFKLITFTFAFRELLLALINVWLIREYGVEAFDKGIVIKQILNWGITGVAMYGFFHISKLLYRDEVENRPEPSGQSE